MSANNPTPTSKLPTPVDPNRLAYFLQGYNQTDTQYLVQGFTNGFIIEQQQAFYKQQIFKNHTSSLQNPQVVRHMLQKELEANRIEGPFAHPPFHNFVCSPIGLRKKKEPGKYRLIHDLSFPENQSVNDKIPDQAATVKYQTLDHVISLLQKEGRRSFMAKADIKEAFRIIPIAPIHYHLLGFQYDNQFYYDKVLPMGLRSSCAIFETFSKALHRIMQTKFQVQSVSHILDDFLFISQHRTICNKYLQDFLWLCDNLGVPIKQEKTILPQTQIEAHGILLDSIHMQARLPQDKVQKARDLLQVFSSKQKTTLKDLQSLIGTLQFELKSYLRVELS